MFDRILLIKFQIPVHQAGLKTGTVSIFYQEYIFNREKYIGGLTALL